MRNSTEPIASHRQPIRAARSHVTGHVARHVPTHPTSLPLSLSLCLSRLAATCTVSRLDRLLQSTTTKFLNGGHPRTSADLQPCTNKGHGMQRHVTLRSVVLRWFRVTPSCTHRMTALGAKAVYSGIGFWASKDLSSSRLSRLVALSAPLKRIAVKKAEICQKAI